MKVNLGVIQHTTVNVATTRYTKPTDSGPYAKHGPSDTAAARADANSIHRGEKRVYDIDKNIDAALKEEVIAEVEET